MIIENEIVNRFIVWTKIKIRIHFKSKKIIKKVYFREKEIWWAHLGKNVGHEEDGKNSNFERPVIVFKKFNRHIFWGMPTSSKQKPNNYFYFPFNLNGKVYSAVFSQLRPLSVNRLIRRIGSMQTAEFIGLKKVIIDFIKNDSRTNE